jgi:hypothetical protein
MYKDASPYITLQPLVEWSYCGVRAVAMLVLVFVGI